MIFCSVTAEIDKRGANNQIEGVFSKKLTLIWRHRFRYGWDYDDPDDEDYDPENPKRNIFWSDLGPFLPGILAIKINTILKLEQRQSDFRDFWEAVNTAENGLLGEWKLKFPHIIEHISLMILGFKDHEKFQHCLDAQIKDVDDYMETFFTLDKEGPDFEFINIYLHSSPVRPSEHQKWIDLKLESFVKKFDINRHYNSSKWGTTYLKYFHRLIEKYPRARELMARTRNFDLNKSD